MAEQQTQEVIITDTTLRDGEQTAGVVFSQQERRQIACMLDEIGVQELECGIPAMGRAEQDSIRALVDLGLNARLMTWNRALISDIQDSLHCGVTAVDISLSLSDIHIEHKLKKSRKWVKEQLRTALSFAKRHQLYVSVGGEDSSRADMDFIIELLQIAEQEGADRFRYCDTLGILNPMTMFSQVQQLAESTNLDLEVHTHNDLGMATANAVAGIMAGARFASTTVNGLGERAGNAALEEVVMALKHSCALDPGIDASRFTELSRYVGQASSRPVSPWKAVVGERVFSHESGLHTDGVLKNPENYEGFNPSEVGLQRYLVLGKHSGRHGLEQRLLQLNCAIDPHEVNSLLTKVRDFSQTNKRALSDQDLLNLCAIH
ncbi:homocitrate synthase NifV [Desulfuromusa kysingii]|uniref:Homocitrate synthase n=1 Tax=Desulfuromusa kysingii TaxID=37625 RepID=A0A1H4DJD0_9BACT|nr:homocitrate synthase [Desulfuromusa kysingii]SEA72322.1 homocitrate synthase NifV [Desulfuromusa kysingii]